MQILESKGDIGAFAHPKPQVTAPKEFHFSTDDRLCPPSVADLFGKVVIESHVTITNKLFSYCQEFSPLIICCILQLSLCSESSSYSDRNGVPRHTRPNPFNLHTEVFEIWIQIVSIYSYHIYCLRLLIYTLLQERGHLKEAQLAAQLARKQMENEKARLYKANPYPYTTDYPVVPENFFLNFISYSLVDRA
jgi:targeting protein for Xklp2